MTLYLSINHPRLVVDVDEFTKRVDIRSTPPEYYRYCLSMSEDIRQGVFPKAGEKPMYSPQERLERGWWWRLRASDVYQLMRRNNYV